MNRIKNAIYNWLERVAVKSERVESNMQKRVDELKRRL